MALTVASTRDKVIMIEAGANEIPEDKMIEAIYAAHDLNKTIIEFLIRLWQIAVSQNMIMLSSRYLRIYMRIW